MRTVGMGFERLLSTTRRSERAAIENSTTTTFLMRLLYAEHRKELSGAVTFSGTH